MSGDRRGGHNVYGRTMGPVDDDFGGDLEDRTVTSVGGHRHYHIRAAVTSVFSAETGVSRGYHIVAEVKSTFKARANGEKDPGNVFFAPRPETLRTAVTPHPEPKPEPEKETLWNRLKRWWN